MFLKNIKIEKTRFPLVALGLKETMSFCPAHDGMIYFDLIFLC